MGCQLRRQVNGGGAVRTADDADGGGLLQGKAEKEHPDIGDEDPELGTGADDEGLGIGDERSEIRHGPQPQKDHAGNDLPFHTVFVEGPDQLRRPVLREAHEGDQWEVHQKDSEADGHQQKGFVIFGHRQVKKEEGHRQHDHLFEHQVGQPRLSGQNADNEFKDLIP